MFSLSATNQYANGYPGNKVIAEMGLVIGDVNWSNKIVQVSPMPVPEYNIWNAIQTVSSSSFSSIALSTLSKSAQYVINDVTIKMECFKPFFNMAENLIWMVDADINKPIYAMIIKLFNDFLLKKVCFPVNLNFALNYFILASK